MIKKFTFNIPNILTLIRIALVPFAVFFAAKDRMMTGAVIYVAACATDVLDGMIARGFNQITDTGKLLDPLADKLMIISVVITFTALGYYPLFVLLIIAIKELLMIAGAIYMLKKDVVVHANVFGKIAALATHLSIGFAFLHDYYGNIYMYLMYAAIAMTIFAIFQYFYIYVYKKDAGIKPPSAKTDESIDEN